MVEQRIRRIDGNLRSIEDFRQRALATGNVRQAASAEQSIVHLEEQVAMLVADLEQHGAGGDPERHGEGAEDSSEYTRMGRPHILAINGDPDFLNIMRSLLQDERYNVTTTNYVPKSFAQIASLVPALLIIDLMIGERAGWDLLERLHAEAETRGIPVVAVSSEPSLLNRARANGRRYGVRRFLTKPLDLHGLLAAIDELIGQA